MVWFCKVWGLGERCWALPWMAPLCVNCSYLCFKPPERGSIQLRKNIL